MESDRIEVFRDTVWDYYHEDGRHDLPWRLDTSSYSVVISEVMLQQTQVSRVLIKYAEFKDLFPDLKTLAAAAPAEVLQVWQGLGYNRRGLWLQQLARMVQDEFNGEVPSDPVDLIKLPGIGPNTAGSIAAFAFNAPVVFIETNIRRVFIHHFFGDAEMVTDQELLRLIRVALDMEHPREWYWALMDYGSNLAKIVPNPNRQSKHYTRQSKFAGSDRQIRGEILRQLLAEQKVARAVLIERLGQPKDRLDAVIAGLVKDGMITVRADEYRIVSN